MQNVGQCRNGDDEHKGITSATNKKQTRKKKQTQAKLKGRACTGLNKVKSYSAEL